MNADVCLSAPVVFEMAVELAKVISHKPHIPIVKERQKKMEESEPMSWVFQARRADIFVAIVRG